MRELSSRRLIGAKGVVFLGLSLTTAALLLLEAPSLKVAVLLAILVWSACRFYYFLVYVLQHYVDPGFRYAGLLALLGRLKRTGRMTGGADVSAIVLLASALACVPSLDPSLVGLWESAATSRGGIGQALELKATGALLSSTTVMIDQVYRATEGTLFIAGSTEALRAATGGTAFTVTGDLLVQTDGQGGEIRKE